MVILLLNFIFQVCGCCGILCSATEHDQSERKPLPDILHQCTGRHGCLHCSGFHCQKVRCCLLNSLSWQILGYLLFTIVVCQIFFKEEFWKQDLIVLTFGFFLILVGAREEFLYWSSLLLEELLVSLRA